MTSFDHVSLSQDIQPNEETATKSKTENENGLKCMVFRIITAFLRSYLSLIMKRIILINFYDFFVDAL